MVLSGALIAALFYGSCQHYKVRKKCTDNGGHWVKYDCRDVATMSCSYDDKGNLSECHVATHEACKERCDGASAEANE